MTEPVGVLLMAYGTPAGLDEIEAYYTHIRRGNPPPPELLEELTSRYRAIGGGSPLLEITRAQASALESELGLARAAPVVVRLGMKHAPPFIEDGVRELAGAGVRRAVGLVLAPHYSPMSVGQYIDRARAAAAELGGPELAFVEHWHVAPGYVELLADRVADALLALPVAARAEPQVVFTAHSLPERVLALGDPYPGQLQETAAAVAERVGLRRWSVAWQSAGRTPEPWIGPDVLDVVRGIARDDGASAVVVCPAGFVADHLEVLYDLDVECAGLAGDLGLAFARTASPNDDPLLIRTLAELVSERLAGVGV